MAQQVKLSFPWSSEHLDVEATIIEILGDAGDGMGTCAWRIWKRDPRDLLVTLPTGTPYILKATPRRIWKFDLQLPLAYIWATILPVYPILLRPDQTPATASTTSLVLKTRRDQNQPPSALSQDATTSPHPHSPTTDRCSTRCRQDCPVVTARTQLLKHIGGYQIIQIPAVTTFKRQNTMLPYALLSLFLIKGVAGQGFYGNCSRWSLGWDDGTVYPWFMVAECSDEEERTRSSFIPLSDCFANREGEIVAERA